jgi:hypothetical protein
MWNSVNLFNEVVDAIFSRLILNGIFPELKLVSSSKSSSSISSFSMSPPPNRPISLESSLLG